MKRIKTTILMLTTICLLCGCTKSNIIHKDGDDSLPQLSSEGIVWEQVWDEFQSQYADEAWYPFVSSVGGGIEPTKKELELYLFLNEEITAQEMADYATEAIKGFNDFISAQNHDYAPSSDSSYGGYVSKCKVHVMIGLDAPVEDNTGWLLEDTIPAGEYRPVNPEAVPAAGESVAEESES